MKKRIVGDVSIFFFFSNLSVSCDSFVSSNGTNATEGVNKVSGKTTTDPPVQSLPLSIEPRGAIDIVKRTQLALASYDSVLERIMPWKTYEKQITCFERDYSIEAGTLIGETKTLLMNVMDSYFNMTESLREWCALASHFSEIYLRLFEGRNEDKAKAQRSLLVRVLEIGITGINSQRDQLNYIHSSFVTAADKVEALNGQLQSDFDEKRHFFKSQVNKILRKVDDAKSCLLPLLELCHFWNSNVTAGMISGPFGLNISYNIASDVTEEIVTQNLRERSDTIKFFFKNLKSNILGTKADIEEMTISIEEEIKTFSELRNQIEKTEVTMQSMDADVASSVQRLISICNQYQEHLRIIQISASQTELCASLISNNTKNNTTL